MNSKDLLRLLVEQHAAIVRTEHHVQVSCGKGYHDIWWGKDGLKAKFYGNRRVEHLRPESLLKRLGNHRTEDTDLAWMQSLQRFLKRTESQTADVYVDAGWKAGVAQIAVIKCLPGGDREILVRRIIATASDAAEAYGITLARSRFPDDVVHSDCKSVVEQMRDPKVKWIPRDRNKEADKFGNMRGKS